MRKKERPRSKNVVFGVCGKKRKEKEKKQTCGHYAEIPYR